MSRFTDYEAAAEAGEIVPIWRLELLGPDGALLATDDPAAATGNAQLWGAAIKPIAVLGNRFSTRQATLSVVDTDGLFMPSSQGALLHPTSGNRVRVSAGVHFDGADIFWQQATMLPNEVIGSLSAQTIELQLVDTLRPVDSQLTDAFLVTEGETVESVVSRLLADLRWPATIAATGFTMPGGAFEPGEDRRSLINELLESVGHELTADTAGRILSRPIGATSDDVNVPRWRYGAGGLPVEDARRIWRAKRPQGYRVESGDFQSGEPALTKLIFDTDPVSEGYFTGPGETNFPTLQYAFAQTNSQLAAAGYGQLRRHGLGPCILDIDIIPNPAMLPGDIMHLEIPRLHTMGSFRVIDIGSLPLQNDGLMTVRVRGTYDPAIGYDVPVDQNNDSGCLTSFSDDFDRPDENLEDLESSPGSPVWSELQYSWNVRNGEAVQLYPHSPFWSLGFVNTPICSSDVQMTIEVARIPAGRFVGPVVRCSGEIDGYVAMADSSGRITLEMWLAGKAVASLGQHNAGGSINGKELRVQAVGSSVSVKLDGTTVISATDDRRTGAYVGMLGYGGSPVAQAPAVASVSAGSV